MSDYKQIELSIDDAHKIKAKYQEDVDLYLALERLQDNPDFKAVFMEDYLNVQPSRLTALLSEPDQIDERPGIYERLIGISRFREYIRSVSLRGRIAHKNIYELEEKIRQFHNGEVSLGQEVEITTNS